MGERWRRDGERDKRGKLIEWNGMEAKVGMEGRGEGTARVINSETEKKKRGGKKRRRFPTFNSQFKHTATFKTRKQSTASRVWSVK